MDGLQLRQRPASNISLNSTYRAHGRPINYSNYRQTPHRRPLRIVNENVALLRGPGPLESMLKTTTETGDIGIFSIKPRSSSAAAMYLSPSRSRSQCGEMSRYPFPSARDYDDNFFYHDHQRLHSNRDTTSEILSLYGSESQHTMPTLVSSSIDNGVRSYSLNTLSSRHAPFHHRFQGPLQSPASSHCLQRPRSPFPYPTRLKRPGVRPASPALGENGDVDYSRMVELERYSQRTVHGSYKATYSHGHRRPPPLSLRADANRSTASLPSRTSPSMYCYGAHNFHARTPTTSWTSRHSDRYHDGSIDQSTRSASLTSIVEMYSRPMDFSDSSRPLHSTSSFYYDYTEEFENQPPSDIERDIPLCPVPQRAGSIRRPMVLRDDSPTAIETADSEINEAKVDEKGLHEGNGEPIQKGTTPGSRTCIHEAETGSASPTNSMAQSQPAAVVTELEAPQSGMPASPAHRVRKDRPASAIVKRASLKAASRGPLNEREEEVLRELSPNRRTWRNSGAGCNVKGEKRSRRDSKCSLAKLRYSLDPSLSDFASILSSFDRVGKSPSPKLEVEAPSPSHAIREELNQPDEAGDQGHRDTGKRQDRRLSLPTFAASTAGDQTYQKGHRRNFAALRISTTAIPPGESTRRVYPDLGKELPILAPEPISPVRHLRVKQSIPYLMKALPPLPREASAPFSQSKEIAEDVSRACGDVLQTLQEIMDEETRFYDPETKPLPTPVKESRVSQSSPQKFKIRGRTSLAASGDDDSKAAGSAEGAHGRDTPMPRSSPVAVKPRLKLRLSRSQLGQSRASHNIAGLPRNRLKQCNSLAEVTSYTRIRESDGHSTLCFPVREQESPSAGGDVMGPVTECGRDEEGVVGEVDDEQPRRSIPVSEPSDQFNLSYPPLPMAAKADTTALLEHRERLSETASVSLSPYGQRGLRGKLSMLRLRFGRAQSRISSRTDGASPVPIREEPAALPLLPLAIDMYDSDDVVTEKGRGSGLRQVQNGWRIKRWAHDAKRVVRSYVKKKNLDR